MAFVLLGDTHTHTHARARAQRERERERAGGTFEIVNVDYAYENSALPPFEVARVQFLLDRIRDGHV